MERSVKEIASFRAMASDRPTQDARSQTLFEQNCNLAGLVRVESDRRAKLEKTIESLHNDINERDRALNLLNRSIDSVCFIFASYSITPFLLNSTLDRNVVHRFVYPIWTNTSARCVIPTFELEFY